MTTRIFKIKLADADCERLYAIASKRRLSFDTLLTMLVRIVLRDNLIDAVIDDGKGARPGDDTIAKPTGPRHWQQE
jgi:hypothetical protein